ncbi:aldehyde dehydrogenase family protein [Metabacillus sediminilitoris]|uniref:Aldehyde dehydrogenase family protein n=1 Tax=Metabacillus sediminilitoris TaxID=2567941 RepID=A0A4S4BLM1_9BACI|nr:aldehyde dehydrogenase family protein [Metabacillus sediminilitoris]QGQ45610.1 aldehyde dehydrogenase family protein [Metabacillus sediminilitoris]THF75679.1 aldehyde dehydrogenase family protein [Metabacillus sediminilitoris]
MFKWVHEAVEQGARVVCGNKRNKSLFFPTLPTDVKPDMKVSYKEIFAPVVSAIPFKDMDEVIRLVNDSDHGLQAGAFTNDINTKFYLANQIEMGGLNINDTSNWRADIIPYGGIKIVGLAEKVQSML